ncbi:ABC transporter substrate-binding protein [Ensifer adhaerens]|uniref:ABC transporter substrate-binding protein n=1 Tax=Ensifer adhaerens TaxID=106592 RepID=UPI003D0234BF
MPRFPQRIVCAGFCDDDSLLAFGVRPIAMVRRGMFESGIAPWCEPLLGGTRPLLLDGVSVDYETILTLGPDLIVNVFSGADELVHRRLSQIAPTVTYRSGPWMADWREQTRLIGAALGRGSDAEQLIGRARGSIRELAAANPSLAGRTFTFATHFAGSGSMVVYLPGETRVDWLIELGMLVAPGVDRLARANPGRTSVDVSLELLDTVDADILVAWYEEGAREAMEQEPLFQLFAPVRRQAYVPLEDPVSVWAASWPSVLSIPHVFPRLVPALAEAAGRARNRSEAL